MKFTNNQYQPPIKNIWQGRSDNPPGSAFFQIIKLLDLNQLKCSESKITKYVLIGFECDEGVKRNLGKPGAIDGPNEFRNCFAKLPVHLVDFEIYDVGNIFCKDNDLESAQEALGNAIYILLKNGFKPIVIGGGHEVAWGHYQGIRKFIKNKNLGIVNFDAHLDMRNLLNNKKGSSGTPFLQIALDSQEKTHQFNYHCVGVQKTGNTKSLFETAEQYKVKITLADELHSNNLELCEQLLQAICTENDHVYVTLCLDVFASGYAPGVSAPQPLGLSPWQVIPLFQKLIRSKKILSFDIAELCPRFDNNQITAKLASAFVYELLHIE